MLNFEILKYGGFSMNKRIGILISLVSVFAGSSVLAGGYCPTPAEIQNKSSYFQQKALAGLSSQYSTADDAMKLMDEQTAYFDNLVPGCLSYFKTTSSPDCKKLNALSTGYIMLDSDKKPAVKAEIEQIFVKMEKVCPIEVKTLKFMVN